jgi:hypothetical protein
MNLQENIQRIKQMMGLFESIFDSSKFLKIGSKGEDVKELQNILKIEESGIFDQKTKKCVQDFQTKMDISHDGIVGPITKKYIKKLKSGESNWDPPQYCKSNNYSKLMSNKSEDTFKNKKSDDIVIFMAGLETAKNKEIQSKILKNSLGGKEVITHAWTDLAGLKNSIAKYPNAHIVLFSKGCESSYPISNLINDKNKLFIVEPYAVNGNNSVKNAVNSGVPNKNVIVAPSGSFRGAGVVKNATINNLGDHFDALTFVGRLITNTLS